MLTPQEKAELQTLEQEASQMQQVQQQPATGLTPQEAEELAQLEAEANPPMTPQESPGEAFVSGFGQAATMGYLPQIQAALEPAIQKGLTKVFGDPNAELKQQGFKINEGDSSYLQRRDKAIKEAETLASENKTASLVGNIAGGLTSGIGLSALGGATRAATAAGRLGQAAKTGLAVGAVRNPGDTEGELNPVQVIERAKNATSDAITGVVFQGGLESLSKAGQLLKKAPDTLKEYSQVKSFKASGAMLKDFRKAYGKGKVQELGQEMIDNGIVAIGDDVADIARKADLSLQNSGNKIGQIYDQADNSMKNPITQRDISNLLGDYSQEASRRLQGTIGGKEVANKIQNNVLDVLAENPNPSFSDLRKIRSSIDEQINYAKQTQDLPEYQSELLNVRNKIQDMIKGKLGGIDKKLQDKFIRENKTYSNLSDIAKIARDKMAREESNAAFGLRERIQGGVGGVVGGAVGGVPGAIAGAAIGSISTKVARQYGTPFVAITANKVANALQNNPGALGKFSDTLIKAGSVSPKEFVTTVNLLLKKPEFKRKITDLQQK